MQISGSFWDFKANVTRSDASAEWRVFEITWLMLKTY
jgi:hypothetical protein